MMRIRKIAKVVHHVQMDEEDPLDILFWLGRTPSERLAEVTRLRRSYFTWKNGTFPDKIEKVVCQIKNRKASDETSP
jgi:hypothetical protein